jgi:hypothetical protein
MLKLDFCDKFLAEIDNYFASGLPVRRPNNMHNYGLIVNEIGMENSITALQQAYTCPEAHDTHTYTHDTAIHSNIHTHTHTYTDVTGVHSAARETPLPQTGAGVPQPLLLHGGVQSRA